jgi:hypothetical protein
MAGRRFFSKWYTCGVPGYPESAPGVDDALIVGAACLMAAVRIFFLSAAFPLFNSTDESYHYDTVVKYSHGRLPSSGAMDRESAQNIVVFGSPEYIYGPERFGGRFFRPMWAIPDQIARSLGRYEDVVLLKVNSEMMQPPVYYALAALGYRVGRAFGLRDARAIYGIRFLNIFSYLLFMAVAYWATRELFPRRRRLRVGMMALLALLPQDVFYGINNDTASPLFFGAAFAALMTLWKRKNEVGAAYALAGLLAAACVLTKLTNAAIIPVLAVVAFDNATRFKRSGRGAEGYRAVAIMIAACGLPLLFWGARNELVFGDPIGAALKLKQTGWAVRPWLDRWRHPLWSPGGILLYWDQLLARYWRGEYLWHGRPMATPMDHVYSISSALFVGTSAWGALFRRGGVDAGERFVLRAALLCFFLSVMILAYWSVSFDFGNSVYPSRAYPFVVSGRLILGTLLPFMWLYLNGMEIFFDALRWKHGVAVFLIALGIGMCVSQESVTAEVFSSPFNFFHLPPSAS